MAHFNWEFNDILEELKISLESLSTAPQVETGRPVTLAPDEREAVRSTVTRLEKRTDLLREGVVRLSRMSKYLEKELQNTRTSVDAHKGILAPSRQLFPELLARIFVLATVPEFSIFKAPSAITSASGDSLRQTTPVVASVCRYWREIALKTPELWATILIGPRFNKSLITLFIQRSAAHPLNLVVSFERYENQSMQMLLATQPRRWQRINFYLPSKYYEELSRSASLITNVVSCRLDSARDHSSNPSVPSTFLNQSASLQNVVMGESIPDVFARFSLPFASIRVWKSINYDTLPSTLFSEMPILRTLYLQLKTNNFAPLQNTPVQHHLTTLWLERVDGNINLDLLPVLPSLERCWIFMPTQRDVDPTTVIPFFARSGKTIKVLALSMHIPPSAPHLLQQCLSLTPNVSTLHLNRFTQDPFLKVLTVTGQPTDVLPTLDHLRISGKILSNKPAVNDLLASRSSKLSAVKPTIGGVAVKRLRRFDLLPDRMEEEAKFYFDDLKKDWNRKGVKVEVQSHNWQKFVDWNYVFEHLPAA